MITISDKSRHAVAALVELGSRSDAAPVPIVDVAEARGIPLHVVEQLFGVLRRAGVLKSQRGVRGGYSFRRPADQVTLREVVAAVDGDPEVGDPVGSLDAVWAEIAAEVLGTLEGLTIADLVQRESQAREAPMFHI